MAAVKPLAGQLDITDIADAIANDAGATAALAATFLELAGGTMTGLLTLSGPPVGGEGAATKTYVDAVTTSLGVHTGDGTIHFTEGSIDHINILNVGTNDHAAIDTHIADLTLHFTEGSIDHTAIMNIGTNSHADIDTHIADATLHFTEGSISHVNILDIGVNTHPDIDTHIGTGNIHRVLNDAGSSVTELWSSSKIEGELAAKVDVAGDTMTGDLTMEADVIIDNGATGQLFLADGSLSDPSMAFQSDVDTGIKWGGVDNIFDIVTGSTLRLRVAANGLITAETAAYETLVFGNAAALPNLAYIDANYLNLGGGVLTGALEVSAGGLDVSGGNLVASAGNIEATLGNITALAGIVNGQSVTSDSSMAAVGGVTAGTWFRGGEGTGVAPGFAFTNDTTSGMWQGTTNALDFASNGLNRLRIASDGTLEVKAPTYEALVTSDDDVPNKKYVDDEISSAVSGAPHVAEIVPSIGILPAVSKVALGPLGPGAAAFPSGAFAIIVDDGSGAPGGPFTMVMVDLSPGWVRVDLPTTYIS